MKLLHLAPAALAALGLLLPAAAAAPSPAAQSGNTRNLGGPIPGLTQPELDAFYRGKRMFEKRFRPSEGLGPFYNATSCQSCHSDPVTGGSSPVYRNFFLAVYGTLSSQGSIPPFLSPVVPAFGHGDFHPTTTEFTLEGGRTVIPTTLFNLPVFSAQRNALPIFGVGLFEFVSDTEILSRVDVLDADGDGISGRENRDFGASVGRFGTKAQSNNIELFTRAPLQNQMGITSDPFLGAGGIVSLCRMQVSSNPNDPTVDADPVPDPEINTQDLGDLIAYSRFLAPPDPLPFDDAATRGQAKFDAIGCTKCHVPTLPSSRGPIHPYTDLLVHFMGNGLADNIKLGMSGSTALEFRTQPLWGVSLHAPFLHDGRAQTLLEAILAHGGEAQAYRDAFDALPQSDKDDVISFLEHL
jgi:CxxC motif-containing protein (DUF1111 family)